MTANDHGAASTYTNHKCRCEECRRDWARLVREGKRRRLLEGIPDDDPRHGTEYCYQNYCRKECCRKAHREYGHDLARRKREQEQRRVEQVWSERKVADSDL